MPVKSWLKEANLTDRQLFFQLVKFSHPDWWKGEKLLEEGVLKRTSSFPSGSIDFHEILGCIIVALEGGKENGNRKIEVTWFTRPAEVLTLNQFYECLHKQLPGDSLKCFIKKKLLENLA